MWQQQRKNEHCVRRNYVVQDSRTIPKNKQEKPKMKKNGKNRNGEKRKKPKWRKTKNPKIKKKNEGPKINKPQKTSDCEKKPKLKGNSGESNNEASSASRLILYLHMSNEYGRRTKSKLRMNSFLAIVRTIGKPWKRIDLVLPPFLRNIDTST